MSVAIWMILCLLGAAALCAALAGHRQGHGWVDTWPLWAFVVVVALVVGTFWPTGAS